MDLPKEIEDLLALPPDSWPRQLQVDGVTLHRHPIGEIQLKDKKGKLKARRSEPRGSVVITFGEDPFSGETYIFEFGNRAVILSEDLRPKVQR